MKNRFRLPRWSVPVFAASLAACSPQPQSVESEDSSDSAPKVSDVAPPGAASGQTGDPIAQGRADTGGLTAPQIEAMYAAALGQAKPSPDHKAVCLDMATDARGVRRDPPDEIVASIGRLVDRPVVPASRCAFEDYPYVIESRERAMLYSVVVEPKSAGAPIKFWLYATYGNLGANGAEFVLRHGSEGWRVEPTGAVTIS